MSEEKFEIKLENGDKYEGTKSGDSIVFKKKYESSIFEIFEGIITHDPEPTFREKVGYALCNSPKALKIFLVLFFDIYGILYRWGSNRASMYIFSFVQFFMQMLTVFVLCTGNIVDNVKELAELLVWAIYECSSTDALIIFFGIYAILSLIPWIMDLIEVAMFNDIVFLGRKKYKTYKE